MRSSDGRRMERRVNVRGMASSGRVGYAHARLGELERSIGSA